MLVDHEFVDFDGRLLPVFLLCDFDRIVKRVQFNLAFLVRLQAVLKHLLTDRRELLLIRANSNVKKDNKCPCYLSSVTIRPSP